MIVPTPFGPIPSDWREALGPVASDAALADIGEFVGSRRSRGLSVLPRAERVFASLELTPLASVRALVLGQDPYPDPRYATGLAFSIPSAPSLPLPRSLQVIRRELEADRGVALPTSGSLEPWAKHGVLLLNTVLTVQVEKPRSHRRAGWTRLTDAIIRLVAERDRPVAFLLWGIHAQAKARLIDRDRHVIVCSPHPSPLARARGQAFEGSHPFSRADQGLVHRGAAPINWALE
ncbi:MAG: uracil-DNA glycosylase [Chloroflexi bacterium]|nr:uracil-DNA glycosylase [Chloroflexota bacterium]